MSRTFSDRSKRVSNEDRPARGRRREPSIEEGVEFLGLSQELDDEERRDLDAIREATTYLLDDVDQAESIAEMCARGRR